MFPNRSGGQVAYLERAYPRPAFLFPATYAFFTVALFFFSSNAVVLAHYIYRAAGYQASEWANKGLAVVSYSFPAFLCLVSTKWSMRILNPISAVRLVILLFIFITGFMVLGGGTMVQGPRPTSGTPSMVLHTMGSTSSMAWPASTSPNIPHYVARITPFREKPKVLRLISRRISFRVFVPV
jgi:amino acid transporter